MSPVAEEAEWSATPRSGFAFVVAAPLWRVRWSKCTSPARSWATSERNFRPTYVYICLCRYIYMCALPVHAPRHPAAQGIYISKWRWSLAAWRKAALSADRPRDGPRWHEEGANFPRIPSVYSRIDGKTTFFIFVFFCSHEKETLLRMRHKEKFID